MAIELYTPEDLTLFEASSKIGVPTFIFKGQKIAVTALTYSYKTKTDKYFGECIVVVDGYLHGETEERRFVYNIATESIEEVANHSDGMGRVFEVLDKTSWVATPYECLKANDVIRIIDNGRLCSDLDGTDVWIVVGKDENGNIQATAAVPKGDAING